MWKDGGGRGPLPIEVEMWEGVVRERAGEPACLRELTEAEKKVKEWKNYYFSAITFLT